MNKALYRKLRPSKFDDVIGQEHITTTLKNQVKSGNPSHAYLFFGSRGTGKTSCSKILAKAVNCPNQKDGNPCCECEICLGIDNDSILDVTEIDAASNSGVDNIRELREEANFMPVVCKYRVYIIDETHMLSTGAFNALLKIMEEPPKHVIFILATTEIHKVPATILSRCQRFDFHRIYPNIMADYLMNVAEHENISLHKDAALLISRLSDGAMRDALSLLDLCSSVESDITLDKVHDIAGLSDQSYLYDMAKYIIENDYMSAITLLADLWIKSIDPTQFAQQLLGLYRNLLVVKSAKNSDKLLEIGQDELDLLKELAQRYSTERIFYSITTLSDSLAKLSQASNRRTEFEIGLLKLCNLAVDTSSQALLSRIEQLEYQLKSGSVLAEKPAENIQHKTTADLQTESTATAIKKSDSNDDISENDQSTATVFNEWADVLDVLKKKNIALFGTLIDSKAYVSGDLLLVDAGSDLFTNMVRSDEYARDSLRESAFVVTNKRYRLGPYEPDRYKTAKEKTNSIDDIIKSAQKLGVDIEITE